MKIYITRHSKTLWNEQKRLQGTKDSPLSDNGIENAYCLKKYLSKQEFDYVYSSPIKRALDTAYILNNDIIIDERIREMNFGDFEGLFIDKLSDNQKQLYSILWNHPEMSKGLPNGESYDEIEMRVQSFIDDLKQLNVESNVLIVTHGFCFVILYALMMGIQRKDYPLYNKRIVTGCSLTIIDYNDDKFHVETYGDDHFLKYKSYDVFAK